MPTMSHIENKFNNNDIIMVYNFKIELIAEIEYNLWRKTVTIITVECHLL
jgi:hypothetical protein